MDWLVIAAVVGLVVAALIAIVAARAAGAADSERDSHRSERVAIWQAGYTDADLRTLAGMAAAARAELGAGEVEVVLAHAAGTGDGVVVTGSRLPRGRLGSRIPRGDGLAGRGLAAGRTTLAGLGDPHAPNPSEGLVAMSVPIVSRGAVVGVVTASVGDADRLFGPWHVARLEALAEEAGRRLGPPSGGTNEERETG